ncbi:PVC-type heme-binding CxxCH protein [Maribacter ulvicola]|uniref:Putative membrane-bound dehydrogenase domain-containing protein n=1 Tax=Maribacter ulvicola TaxID=228959 RepID=A0A1N7AN62_9FLAO|nr:PVC-type heme-binding CxxCH protein [Maribacter ulvicola]SIR40485.1 putative membrane-bound dehydrogenase domain-containing protein [Maribacter ulvicola]
MKLKIVKKHLYVYGLMLSFLLIGCSQNNVEEHYLQPKKNSRIVLVGNNLGSRMMEFGHFETEVQLKYPDSLLFIRNMSDGGNTPGFRPHPSRKSPWAFPGADKYVDNAISEHFTDSKGWLKTATEGHFETPDEWLTRLKADIIIAFFGYGESFSGNKGVENFKMELQSFIDHTLKQKYNGKSSPQLALVSPIAFENLSSKKDLPNGINENKNLSLYTTAMKEVAAKNNIILVNTFETSKDWYEDEKNDLTLDGFQLNDRGYRKFSKLLANRLFGKTKEKNEENRDLVHEAVMEKNWFWHKDFKIPNGVHAYGRRYKPYGPDNYPDEIEKIREMTHVRDTAIWDAGKGKKKDLLLADQKTKTLPQIETNYRPSNKNGTTEYLYGDKALEKIKVAPGYKIELFASEKEFTDLANPVQLSFDNKGRLWVAVMPSYPHYKPGDQRPNDKLIILEDTDNDGKADKQTTFADGLHLPIGFELAPEGVYVSQGTNLVLLKDTNGDDRADVREVVLSGFDDHDTHHAISAFSADPSGAIYMGEGVFLHSNIETSYGTVRGTNGGFFRYNPQRHHLERTAQLPIPNPWGIAFDEWGQNFFAHTSGPDMTWMMPGTIKPRYGEGSPTPKSLIEKDHKVRPTSGLEFVSSRHFPDEVQGDVLINNTIGFLGTKQHNIDDDPTTAGYTSKHRMDLVSATDKNFRPVDMEFAPDGSLFLIDWHNVLIGHMQHNARDPLRDHVHGRIYRITYPERPLVQPAKIYGADIEELLNNLKLPEYRTRYRTRRELRSRNATEVMAKLKPWVDGLNKNDQQYEHHLVEALWVAWGLNEMDEDLLKKVFSSKDSRARAAAVRVVRYMGHRLDDQSEFLMMAAKDENPRVRLEALVAASWLKTADGLEILNEINKKPLDEWMKLPFETAMAHFSDHRLNSEKKTEKKDETALKGKDKELFMKGKEVYHREGFCATCHQPDGQGLTASQFPPLASSKWVTGSKERLIKLTLHGLMGPIEVRGKKYPGQVPMTPFGGMLKDDEVAAVLTYVRNSFGNKASSITPALVKKIKEETKERKGFYTPKELLKEHPFD